MLSILGNRKIIVSILAMVFLIVGVQSISYAQIQVTSAVSPTSVAPGGSFTLTATVTNGSTAQTSGTKNTIKFYKSDNATINANNEEVGSVIVSALGANVARTVGISMPAPADTGNYYYGACVGTICSSGKRLVVTTLRPNLSVSLVYVPGYYNQPYYNQIVPGGRFTLRATVTNTGNGPSSAGGRLEIFYRTAFSLNDIPATSVTISPPTVPSVTAEGTSIHNISLLAPTTPGTYNYYVRVTPVPGDGGPRVNVTPVRITTSAADLAVDTPTVDKSTVAPGESFTLTATVRNNGFGPSSANATLQYYRSTDSTISAIDTPIGTAVLIGRALSGRNTAQGFTDTSTHTVDLTAPTTPGTYYYGAHVRDLISNEPQYNTANNYSTAVAITVSAPPDLVAEIFGFRPDTVAPGARLTLDATVTNEGEGQSPRTTLRFYESTDRRFRSEDEIDRVTVAELVSNRSTNESIRLIAPDTPGTYYYRVRVDEVANEEATLNNTSGYIVLFVEVPLVIESVQPSESTLTPGERFTLTATVRNDGSTTSTRTAVEFYSSDDNSITSRDTSIGTDSVSVIAARGTGQASLTLNAPNTEGTYYYGACLGDGTSSCEVVRITVVEQTIVANLERPPMYWVDSDGGTLQSLTGSEVDPFVRSVRDATAIAVDMAGGKVYWAERINNDRSRVRRANLNGTNVELVKEISGAIRGIAIDSSKGNLYLTNSRANSRGNIQRSRLDGTLFHVDYIDNLSPSLSSPRDIALDVAGGKVYWTEDISDARTGKETIRIRRANLNGTNVEVVREVSGVPRGIAIDSSKGHIYLANTRGVRGNIQRLKLDGTLFHWNYIHIDRADSPQGVTLDTAGGKVYWTEAGKIRRANLNGSNRQDVATGIGSPAGIALSVAPVNNDAAAAPGAVAATADATALHANYPNPFNPETWIPYQLQHAADVTVTIYDLRGTIVRQLLLGHQPAGVYHSRSRAAHWDGRNNLGEPVASGLYFYTLTAGDFTATRKMLIRK